MATFQRSIHLPSTFRALRHRNYRLWFMGQTVSLVGVWMQSMAQQVLIYRLTGSAAALGMVNFLALIPLIPLSLWGGSFIDRHSKRNIIIWTQIGMMVEAFLLAALTWAGTIQIWHVYVLSFILGAINAVDVPARQAFTVDMVEGRQDLTNAIGLNSAMFNLARALGPALAGLVVAAVGEAMAFFLNGLTFVAVLASLMFMRDLPAAAPDRAGGRDGLAHILEGLQFTLRRRSIFFLISLIAVSAFLSMPYSTLMPVFSDQVLGASARPVIDWVCGSGPATLPIHLNCQAPEALPLGILLTTVGIGALAGALVVASLPDSARRGHFLTVSNLAFPVLLLAFAASRVYLVSVVLLLAVGFTFVMQNALANTLLQIVTPDELRGRVMSVYTMVFQSTMRMGGLQAGLLADRFGAPFSVAIGAAISLMYGAWVALKVPEVRGLK